MKIGLDGASLYLVESHNLRPIGKKINVEGVDVESLVQAFREAVVARLNERNTLLQKKIQQTNSLLPSLSEEKT